MDEYQRDVGIKEMTNKLFYIFCRLGRCTNNYRFESDSGRTPVIQTRGRKESPNT